MATETVWKFQDFLKQNLFTVKLKHLGKTFFGDSQNILRTSTLILLLTTSNLSYGTPVDYGPKWISPSDDFATPHIEWQKPSVNGSMNVLFITCREGMREAVELRQRFDMNVTVFATEHSNKFVLSGVSASYLPEHPTLAEMENDLLKKLEGQYDVMVLAGIMWDALPLWARYRLLKKVSEGTSLVGFISGIDEYLKRATKNQSRLDVNILFPYKGLPAFSQHTDITAFLKGTVEQSQFGEGKILLLKGYKPGFFQPLTPAPIKQLPRYRYYEPESKVETLTPQFADIRPVEYDYYMAYIGHLLMHAGKKIGTVHISGENSVIVNSQNEMPLSFAVDSQKTQKAAIKMVLRNADNEIISEEVISKDLSQGKNHIEFKLKKVPAGDYFADIWVLADGKTAAYGSVFVQAQSAQNIEKVDMPLIWEMEKSIDSKVSIANPDGQWKGFSLNMKRRDNFARLTGEWNFDLSNSSGNKKEVSFSLPPAEIHSIIQYIDVQLKHGNEVIDKRKVICSVKDFYPDNDLRSVIWGPGGNSSREYSYLSMYLNREWYKAGFDSHFTTFNIGLPLANLWHISYATRLTESSKISTGQDAHIRYPGLNDPAYRQKLADILLGAAKEAAPYGTREFSLGNECYFASSGKEMCFAPASKAFFREFLKAEYGSIEKLNEEYETDYKIFDEIEPVLLKDVEANRKRMPLWVDFRRAMESQWADITRFGGDTLRSAIPGAKAGYDGDYYMNSLSAADYYKTGQVNQMNSIYERPFTMAGLRDFSSPGTLIGMGWDGGYNNARSNEYQRIAPWGRVFSGANILWVFMSSPGGHEDITAPDFSYFDFFKTYMKEMKELKAGIGKLLISAKRNNDGIGVMYSASSVHAATMIRDLPQMQAVMNNLCTLLDDSNFQYQAVAYKQISDGILKSKKIKTLFLPYVQALSKKEGEEIRKFVADGGVLIADLRPGVCDEHGKPYKTGLLDDVFGVKQKTDAPAAKQSAIKITTGGFPSFFPETVMDMSLELTSGKAMGNIEGNFDKCLIFNNYGKGKTLLLNFSLSKYYENTDKSPDATRYIEFMQSIFASFGIKQAVTMDPARENLKVYRFESGAYQYIGLLEKLPEPIIKYALHEAAPLKKEWVTLTLPQNGNIYDVRKGEYIGHGNEIKTQIEPAEVRLYSVMPYKIKGIEVKISDILKQGEIFKYNFLLSAENSKVIGSHVFHVELVAPDGSIPNYYSKNITAENGKANGQLELALNELPGQWKLRVNDINTGIREEKTFIVQKR